MSTPKKTPMTPARARAIQSAVDRQPGARPQQKTFKASAARAASRNQPKK